MCVCVCEREREREREGERERGREREREGEGEGERERERERERVYWQAFSLVRVTASFDTSTAQPDICIEEIYYGNTCTTYIQYIHTPPPPPHTHIHSSKDVCNAYVIRKCRNALWPHCVCSKLCV